MYHTLTSHTIFSNIFSRLQLLNRINWTLGFEAESLTDFRKDILSFIRPKAKSFLDCNSSKGLKFVTKLCLGFSHLREHELKQSVQGSSNPLCSCSLDVESPICYFLHYSPLFTIERNTLQNTISQIHNKLLDSNESNFSIF